MTVLTVHREAMACGAKPPVFRGSPCGYGPRHPVHTESERPLGIPLTEADRHEFADPYPAGICSCGDDDCEAME